jgi:hypothetical protein
MTYDKLEQLAEIDRPYFFDRSGGELPAWRWGSYWNVRRGEGIEWAIATRECLAVSLMLLRESDAFTVRIVFVFFKFYARIRGLSTVKERKIFWRTDLYYRWLTLEAQCHRYLRGG